MRIRIFTPIMEYGVDFLALMRALVKNFTKNQRSGASTITMQTIKLWNRQERTYFNKFKEIIQSLALEQFLSKDEILKLYLSNALWCKFSRF